jgi:inorganic pyrophosphatase/exopolyphosphatase
MTKILITAKVNPDLDGTSCALAYAELLRRQGMDAEGIVTGEPQSEARYFIEKQGIRIPQRNDEQSDGWENFILVDASSMKGMPKCVKTEKVLEIIDHRKGNPEKEFPSAKIQNDLIGAAATIIIERYNQAGEKPLLEHAKLLYGAIFHNTLNFIATNTSERDKEAASFLEKDFNLDKSIVHEMFDYSTREIESDLAKALKDDAKEFDISTGWKMGAYQLIVWGEGILKDKKNIKHQIRELASETGAKLPFLNIVNIESAQSILITPDTKMEQVLNKAVGAEFEEGVAVLSQALLRKQIMPKVNDVIGKLS